jgi:predicted nuclease with TOPRIM domain
MSDAPHEPPRPSALRGPVRALRRVLAPAALELEGEATRLTEENAELRSRVEQLEQRLGAADERLAGLDDKAAALQEGLHEARRLNLRLAELTDVVTELVLPLHDREIDPTVLQRLRPETL